MGIILDTLRVLLHYINYAEVVAVMRDLFIKEPRFGEGVSIRVAGLSEERKKGKEMRNRSMNSLCPLAKAP